MAEEHVCPVWVGYFLLNPLRKLLENPKKLLSPYINNGMHVMDVGCAMGFFTLDMAKLAGDNGKVYAVDMQEKMLDKLSKRAEKAGLGDRIETRLCSRESLGIDDLEGTIDLAVAFHVVHEVPEKAVFFKQIYASLKNESSVLMVEPKGHVSEDEFEASLKIAKDSGFTVEGDPEMRKKRKVVLRKNGDY